eukprot:TRINITY_DN2656_c0_g1_i1.p1 TRINITY_DN2656_c0_g1~~TRINITY_DN2656_c0_g1_i1.p1  ORF type:complete len:177 (+),score=39.26 TRINITY_DN2656_c0_g1_i1:223-753(+)
MSQTQDIELGVLLPDDNHKLEKRGLLTSSSLLQDMVRWSPLGHLAVWASFLFYIFGLETRQAEDLSVCGYDMIAPFWAQFAFAWLCFSGGELTVRMIYTLTESVDISPAWPLPAPGARPSKIIKAALRVLSVVIAMSMCGFVAIPRCLFPPHQFMVESFMVGSCVLMSAVCCWSSA